MELVVKIEQIDRNSTISHGDFFLVNNRHVYIVARIDFGDLRVISLDGTRYDSKNYYERTINQMISEFSSGNDYDITFVSKDNARIIFEKIN